MSFQEKAGGRGGVRAPRGKRRKPKPGTTKLEEEPVGEERNNLCGSTRWPLSIAIGFRVSGFGFRVSGFGFRVSGFGFQVSGFGFRVSGFGFRV